MTTEEMQARIEDLRQRGMKKAACQLQASLRRPQPKEVAVTCWNKTCHVREIVVREDAPGWKCPKHRDQGELF